MDCVLRRRVRGSTREAQGFGRRVWDCSRCRGKWRFYSPRRSEYKMEDELSPRSGDKDLAAAPVSDRGQIASQISREIVRLHARLYGRGPTKARTYLQPDYAMCVLEDIFTVGEKTLAESGK